MALLNLNLPDGSVTAEFDMSSGILRLSREDRSQVMMTPVDKITLEADGLVLDGGLIINRLSQKIMVSESTLAKIRAIMAG